MADVDIKAVANTEVAKLELRQWYNDAQQLIAAQIHSELEDVLEDIKANWVPIDTGALRDTGQVIPVVIEGDKISSGIEFGDESVEYARIQHEDLTFYHPHGQAKYIEIPLRNWAESKK